MEQAVYRWHITVVYGTPKHKLKSFFQRGKSNAGYAHALKHIHETNAD